MITAMDDRHSDPTETALFAAVERLAGVGGWVYDSDSETLSATDEAARISGCASPATVTLDDRRVDATDLVAGESLATADGLEVDHVAVFRSQ
jgi:hypothetical protein